MKQRGKSKSIFRTILFSVLAVLIIEIVLLVSALNLSRVGPELDNNAVEILKKQVENRQNYLEALMQENQKLSDLSDKIDETFLELEEKGKIQLETLAEKKGAEYLHEMLQKVDPTSAESIHAHNVKRVIRALEFYHQNGTPISAHNEEQKAQESPYNLAYFVLNGPREILYDRIDRRVDQMLEEGLVKEVENLKKMGCHRGMVSMQGLGYKEILACLEGEYPLEEAVRILKRDTRHFAKRQLTWFRREKDVIWVNKEEFNWNEDSILEYMLSVLRERGLLL